LSEIKAVFISHEHTDHISGVKALSNKIGIPFYINERSSTKKPKYFEKCAQLVSMEAGQEILVGSLKVLPFTSKHDSAYSVGFKVDNGKHVFGYLTDTGMITPLISTTLEECDAILIEADYDEEMLDEYEFYAEELKDRIRSNYGHLGNQQTLDFISQITLRKDLQFIIIGHLSPRTNSPTRIMDLAKQRFSDELLSKIHIAPLSGGLTLG
jgi:phosphoribosyl 1,2-cyclic phosphodiesterase